MSVFNVSSQGEADDKRPVTAHHANRYSYQVEGKAASHLLLNSLSASVELSSTADTLERTLHQILPEGTDPTLAITAFWPGDFKLLIFGAAFGTDGDDRMIAAADQLCMSGLGGNDILQGADGNSYLMGDDGNDRLIGGLGINILSGGAGDDTLYGGEGGDILIGRERASVLYRADETSTTNDQLFGGTGDDRVVGFGSSYGGSGEDYLIGTYC